MGIGLPAVTPPPAALPDYIFTPRTGRAITVRFERDAYRGYNATIPRLGGNEAMVAVRYVDALGFMSDPLCLVYANRSGKIGTTLDLIARALVRYEATVGPGAPPGISWPLSARALARLAAGDYLGFRLRGGAGIVRPIRAADYATAAFYVEPNGVKAGGGGGPD